MYAGMDTVMLCFNVLRIISIKIDHGITMEVNYCNVCTSFIMHVW